MAIIGINGSALFAASTLREHYGLTIEQARLLKTCDKTVECDEAIEEKLVEAGLAVRVTTTTPLKFKED